MAGNGKKWLTGCGIGCGLMILAAGGVGTCGYFGVKRITERAERMDDGFSTLRESYGEPGAFVPAADGTIPADRLEVFVSVREDMQVTRDGLADVLTELDSDVSGPGGVIAKIRGGISLIPRLFDFVDDRNSVLIDRGMGLGEYLHIYTVAYYAWLQKEPADGPSFQISGDDDADDDNFQWSMSQNDADDVLDRRDERIRRYLHDIQREIVGNQLTAAETAGLDADWITALREEAGALDARPLRLLWQDGLPDQTRASLEPFRDRLEASYSEVMNVVEVGLASQE